MNSSDGARAHCFSLFLARLIYDALQGCQRTCRLQQHPHEGRTRSACNAPVVGPIKYCQETQSTMHCDGSLHCPCPTGHHLRHLRGSFHLHEKLELVSLLLLLFVGVCCLRISDNIYNAQNSEQNQITLGKRLESTLMISWEL